MSTPEEPVALVVVPDADSPFDALVAALRQWHPSWEVRTVWAGDPHLRPADVEPAPVDELELAIVDPAGRPLLAALRSLDDRPTVVLVAGSVAVVGPIDALMPERGQLTVVPRILAPIAGDEAPWLDELEEVGQCSASVLGLGAGSAVAAGWLADRLLDQHPAPAGALFDLASTLFPARRCADDAIGVSAWRWCDGPPALVEAPGYDPDRPWSLDPELDGPPRVSLAPPERRETMAAAAPQLGPSPRPLRLPGGIAIDRTIRTIIRTDPPAGLRPWADAAAFRAHLERRYWKVTHSLREDLQRHFPSPAGADAPAFGRWARRAAFLGDAPLLLDPSAADADFAVRRTAARTYGVNLIGYFHHQSGIANVARRVADILDRHGVPHATVAYDRSENPRLASPPVTDGELRYATSLAFVNGDQFAALHDDVPAAFGPGHRVIGVWYWELDTLDGAAPVGDRYADEIWAATTFMATPFEALGSTPVRVVPVPFERPVPSDRRRDEFAPLADAGDRFVFGVTLDHLSITARKNPIGAISAFRDAFDPDDGPLLVVKTINGRRCWREHERLLAAAAPWPDVVVWDEHLDRGDQMAFIASLDALVSLHRSEGLGLHLAEAMWLGVPVIATRYSGNLDFMDDRTAVLVDAELVAVGDDGGWAYPATARWAAPDLGAAATAMRRMADDREWAGSIADAAREAIARHSDETGFVSTVRGLLG